MSLSLVVGILVCDLTGMRALPAASAQTVAGRSVPVPVATVAGGVIAARGVVINGVATDAVFVGEIKVSGGVVAVAPGARQIGSVYILGAYPAPVREPEPVEGAYPAPIVEPVEGAYPAPAPEPVGGAYPAPIVEPVEGAYPAPGPEPVGGAYPAPGPEPVGGAYPAPLTIVGDGVEVIGGTLQGNNIQVTGGVVTGENLVLVGAYVRNSGAQ